MSKLILTLALLALFSIVSATTHEESLNTLWGAWKATHNKHYSPLEETHRLTIFKQNIIKITKLNAENTGVKFAINQFADLTASEFKKKFTNGLVRPSVSHQRKSLSSPMLKDLPVSIDWRTKNAVTPVKNQGSCGSCWAFSAIGALEGLYSIKKNTLLDFSEQNMVDCVQDGCEGCNGGWMGTAFEYVAKYGVMKEPDYPYKGRDQKCQFQAAKAVKVSSGLRDIPVNSSTELKTALVAQPVSVAIEADEQVFQFYKTGVIKSGCGANLDHGVLAVGYQKVGADEAFIVKNSWGNTWGMKGYVYISTDEKANKGSGVCGILSAASVPI